MSRRSTLTRSGVIVAVVAAIVAPVAIAMALTASSVSPLADHGSHAAQETVRVSTTYESVVASVTVRMTLQRPSVPVVTAGGTVTAIYISAGDVIVEGTRLLSIDSVTRIAYVPQPSEVLYRHLCRGDRGTDVTALQRILMREGFQSVQPDGVFGAATERAVIAFNAELGYASTTTCFDPAVLAPISTDVEVEEVHASLGVPFSETESWMSAAPAVSELDVLPSSGADLPDGQYLLTYSGRELAATVTNGVVTVTDVDLLAESTSDVGDVEISASLRSAEPIPVQSVPSSALVVSASGATCVAIALSSSEMELVPVERLSWGIRDVVALAPQERLEGQEILSSPGLWESTGECLSS